MKLLLSLCACAALLTAFWSGNLFVWMFVLLGFACATSLGVLQKHSELACLVASAFFIASGFTSLHSTITTMATDSIAPQVTTFAAPVILVMVSSLSLCVAMVERHAAQSATASPNSQNSPLKRRWL